MSRCDGFTRLPQSTDDRDDQGEDLAHDDVVAPKNSVDDDETDLVMNGLRRAQYQNRPVTVVRKKLRKAQKIRGFVMSVGDQWVLLAQLEDGIYLDGWVALRIADITSVKVKRSEAKYVIRSIQAIGQWPPRLPPRPVDLDEIASLLKSAQDCGPLLGLQCEAKDSIALVIGRPLRIQKGSISLLDIDPQGRWWRKPRTWEFEEITQVRIHGRYQVALARYGQRIPKLAKTS